MQVENFLGVVAATIPLNQALSAAIPSGGGRLVAIEMPAAWTAAGIYVAGGLREAGPFAPISDQAGAEIAITAAAGKLLLVTGIIRFPWIKIGSGTSAAPVNQTAARTVTLLFSSLGD